MTKMALRLICYAAVLMLLCASSVLADARLSITELAQSAPDYWESPLVVDGEQVMVPIYVPDVERMPVLKAQWRQFSEDELQVLGSKIHLSESDFLVQENQYRATPDAGYYFQVCLNAIWQKKWTPTYASIYPNQTIWDDETMMTPEMTYAENQTMSLAEAIEFAQQRVATLFSQEDISFFVNDVDILSCYMHQKQFEYTGQYPMDDLTGVGGYMIDGCFAFGGIPVFSSIESAYQETKKENEFYGLYRKAWLYAASLFSESKYAIFAQPWTVTGVVQEDIPLCSLEKAKAAIQAEIDKGRIKNIYSLKLGYTVFADRNEKYPTKDKGWQNVHFVFVPTWICECSYTTNPNRDYNAYPERDDPAAFDYVRNDWLYSQIMINAQTGTLYDPLDVSDSRVYAPKIETW